MNRYFITILIIITAFATINIASAQTTLAQKLAGRILLQVQSHGEAWYVNPNDLKKYYLGRPTDAFNLMKQSSLGVTHQYISSYQIFPQAVVGKILLDTQDFGKAYYINPVDRKAYFLGRPDDAFNLMRRFSLGISNTNLSQIATGYLVVTPSCTNCQATSTDQTLSQVAQAIRDGDTDKTLSYFTPEMQKAIEYTMNYLTAEGKLILGNIISGVTLSSTTDDEKIYSVEIYFSLGGYKVPLYFHVKKQTDGRWLLANL